MSLSMSDTWDTIQRLLEQGKSVEATQKVGALSYDTNNLDEIITLSINCATWAIQNGDWGMLLCVAGRGGPFEKIRAAISKVFNDPSLENMILANFSEENLAHLLYSVDLEDSLKEKLVQKWFVEDNDKLFISYLYSLGYQSDFTTQCKQALASEKFNIVGAMLSWKKELFKLLPDDNLTNLIEKAIENDQFGFVFAIRNNPETKDYVTNAQLGKIRDKLYHPRPRGADWHLERALSEIKIDDEIILKLYQNKDWQSLLQIIQSYRAIYDSPKLDISVTEMSVFKKDLLTRFGSSATPLINALERNQFGLSYFIPSVEGLTYRQRMQNNAWEDLLPTAAYYKLLSNQSERILNPQDFTVTANQYATESQYPADVNKQAALAHATLTANERRLPLNDKTQELYDLIEKYHTIEKDRAENILPRFKALYDIQRMVEQLLSEGNLNDKQQETLKDIVTNCKSKSKYLMRLRKMPRAVEQRLFRLRHTDGSPLRVDNPNFPSAANETPESAYNPEVLSDLDPYHREFSMELFKQWHEAATTGNTTASFWLWLEQNNSTPLRVNYHYTVPPELFLVKYDEKTGKVLAVDADGEMSRVPDGMHKFNIDEHGILYVDSRGLVTNHSQLVKDALLTAGNIYFEKGKITKIDNGSGHYFPSKRHLLAGVRHLKLNIEAFRADATVETYDAARYGMTPIGLVSDYFGHTQMPKETPKSPKEKGNKAPTAKADERLPSRAKPVMFSETETAQKPDNKTKIDSTKVNNDIDPEIRKPESAVEQEQFLEKIKSNSPDMINISFAHTGFAGWAFGELNQGLPTNTHLTTLDLSNCAIDENSFSDFLKALAQNTSLKNLIINDSFVPHKQIPPLIDICRKKGIRLTLDKLVLEAGEAKENIPPINDADTTQYKTPTSANESDKFLSRIMLNDPAMVHVSFANTGFAGFAQEFLTRAIPGNTNLKSLDLSNCGLVGDHCFQNLLTALEQNHSLERINVLDTPLTTKEIKALQQVCDKKNIQLNNMDVSKVDKKLR